MSVSFENELTLDYLNSLPYHYEFDDYFVIENKIMKHYKKNIISCSLFNNCSSFEIFEKRYLSQFIKLISWIDKNFIGWGIHLYTTSDLLCHSTLFNDPNINIFIMKQNKGLIGTFWRFLSIDNNIERMICIDVDELELNRHKLLIGSSQSARLFFISPNYDYFVDKDKIAKKYSSILAGNVLLCKNDINFNMKNIIIKFLIHQKYYIDDERKHIYNKPIGEHEKGFGNGLFQYGSDERFLSKFLYFYLVKKNKLKTFHNIMPKMGAKENIEDIEFCKKHNNILSFVSFK